MGGGGTKFAALPEFSKLKNRASTPPQSRSSSIAKANAGADQAAEVDPGIEERISLPHRRPWNARS
jgi:hypothetical protein